MMKNENPTAWRSGWIRMLAGVLLLTAVLHASCAEQLSSTSETTVIPQAVSFHAEASWDPSYLTIERELQESDLVVVGRVAKIDAGRWNSPDGNYWQPPEEQTLPVVYTTFYVDSTDFLKGEPKWGNPVAFRLTGGTVGANHEVSAGPSDVDLTVGETVIVFGNIEDRYGPGGAYKPEKAYWVTMEENSIWVLRGDQFVNQGHTKDPAERSLALGDFKLAIQQYLVGQ